MSDELKQKIANLAAIVHDKRQRFQMMGMMNTIGLTPQEARQQSMAYAVAQSELMNAEVSLRSAELEAIFTTSPPSSR